MTPSLFSGLNYWAVLAAAVSAFVIGGLWYSLARAVQVAVLSGAAFVGTSFGVNYLFEHKSLTLFLVNAGYHLAQFAVVGLILGLWH